MIDRTIDAYRPFSTLAVISGVLGVLSLSAWIAPSLLSVAAVAFFVAGITITRLSSRTGDLAGLRLAMAGGATSTICLIGASLWHWHRYVVEVPTGYERVNLVDVFDAGIDDVTPALLALEGRHIAVKAYMDPFHPADSSSVFTISRLDSTGFGATARPGEQLTVKLAHDTRCSYSGAPVVVAGVFDIEKRAVGDGPRFRLILRDASLGPATSSIGVPMRNPRGC